MTRCNRCKLNDMERKAAERGVTVVTQVCETPGDPLHGWISARYSDNDKPTTWFQTLTERCAC